MKKYDEALAQHKPNPCAYVESLGLKGFYRCCMFKWQKKRVTDRWGDICRIAPKIAQKYREVPDIIKQFLGKPKKFAARNNSNSEDPDSTCIFPHHFQQLVGEAVAAQLWF